MPPTSSCALSAGLLSLAVSKQRGRDVKSSASPARTGWRADQHVQMHVLIGAGHGKRTRWASIVESRTIACFGWLE
ncbi:hypothetical protein MSAN_02526700 [Mycena sanguinolenta]|uniref:Uncharacterized protein n=1 Tax=Mycena sanguinolenta TaxID=230812 RepID=A0A8H6TYZ8_9AGAR|nr:hypothetical protein MSAN_02526700 [Mycena sanguinolenta]